MNIVTPSSFNVKRIFSALAITMLMAFGSSCRHVGGQDMVPRELQGAWVTDDPQYAERLVKFWPSEYVILTGNQSQAAVQWVYKVDQQKTGNGFTLTIYSKSRAGNEDQMGLTYTVANGGEMRFRNQRQVWRRVPEK